MKLSIANSTEKVLIFRVLFHREVSLFASRDLSTHRGNVKKRGVYMRLKFIRALFSRLRYVLCRIENSFALLVYSLNSKILEIQSASVLLRRPWKGEKSGKYPPLSSPRLGSCKRLTQPFHASESIQLPHPNSNRIHGNLSTAEGTRISI